MAEAQLCKLQFVILRWLIKLLLLQVLINVKDLFPDFFDMMEKCDPGKYAATLKDAFLKINPDTTALRNMHDKDAARMIDAGPRRIGRGRSGPAGPWRVRRRPDLRTRRPGRSRPGRSSVPRSSRPRRARTRPASRTPPTPTPARTAAHRAHRHRCLRSRRRPARRPRMTATSPRVWVAGALALLLLAVVAFLVFQAASAGTPGGEQVTVPQLRRDDVGRREPAGDGLGLTLAPTGQVAS